VLCVANTHDGSIDGTHEGGATSIQGICHVDFSWNLHSMLEEISEKNGPEMSAVLRPTKWGGSYTYWAVCVSWGVAEHAPS
jgi:hypothetical protein